MIFTSISRILLISTFCFSALGFSAQVNAQHSEKKFGNPYQGNVLVGSFNETQLKNRALQQVLVKVSGNVGVTQRDETRLLLNKTQQLISQYGYRDIQGAHYFSAVFDKNKINQALKDMQQPIWGDTRPTTLIWLINNDEIVSDNDIKQRVDGTLSQTLQQSKQQRGIEVQFPLMDLDDNLALSVSDIKGRFYDQVSEASARYQQAYFVVAELQQANSDRWKLSWQLLHPNDSATRTNVLLNEEFVGSKVSVTQQMVDALADYYASQYAILENSGDKFTQTLFVDGISSLGQLAQLHATLKNMLAISSYTIVAAQQEQVTIQVKLKGGVNSFKNALRVEPHLQLVDSAQDAIIAVPESNALIENGEGESLMPTSAPADALYFEWR